MKYQESKETPKEEKHEQPKETYKLGKKCEVCGKPIPDDFVNNLCWDCYKKAEEAKKEPKVEEVEVKTSGAFKLGKAKNGITQPDYIENPEKKDKEQWLSNVRMFERNGVMLWKPTRQMYTYIKNYCLDKITQHPQYPKFIWKPKIVDVGCFVAGTPILTGNYDETPIEKLKEGNIILSPQNNRRKILKTFVREVDKTYKLNFEYGINVETTEEHPFLSVKKGQLMCSAKKEVLCRFVNGICKRCGKSASVFPEYNEVRNLDKGDFVVIPHLNKVKKTIPNENLVSQLLGYYLAEGWILYSRKPRVKRNICGIGLCFHSKETGYVNSVKDLGEELGASFVSVKTRKKRHTSEVFIYSSEIGKLMFELGGRLSHKKKLSRKVFYFSDLNKLNVITNWLKGDGCHTSFTKAYDTRQSETVVGKSVSPELLNGIRRLCLQIGVCPGKGNQTLVFSGEDVDIVWARKGDLKRNQQRYLKLSSYILIPIKSIKEVRRKTKVYNFEVEGDNSYVANSLAVHNCGCGVGSNVLSQEADFVWGIDKNERSIKFAKECFSRTKNQIYYSSQVSFDCMDIFEDTRETAKFDVVVAVEIIEHINDYKGFLDLIIGKFAKKDKRGNYNLVEPTEFFITTPNRNNRRVGNITPKNKYHVREWTAPEFYNILFEYFNEIKFHNAIGVEIPYQDIEKTTHTPLLVKCWSPKK